jgi:Zn-dependent peptidase ImmA (M78 family)
MMTVDTKPLSGPSSALWLEWRKVRPTAALLLSRFEVSAPPVDVRHIVRKLGIELIEKPYSKWSGVVKGLESGEAVMMVNASDTEQRRRFTMAHELGHLLLHPLGVMFRDHGPATPQELEANQFAGELLIPEDLLRRHAGRYSVGALAALFDVSTSCMQIRLEKLLRDRRR